MILQALADYYEQLVVEHPDRVARPGWCSRQVAFMLELSPEGELVGIIPSDEKRGWTRTVPEQVKRTVGIAANLLCDNATYLLGIDAKGKPERACQCFEAAKERHLAFLADVDSPAAAAVRGFFETWEPGTAADDPAVAAAGEALLAGGNLVFRVSGREVLEDPAIASAWDGVYLLPSDDATVMTCLVSGEKAPIARLHPSIKGVMGAQAMGASLVGFNARAFESYGHDEEQGLNAPVSERVTFAYATALNYLLSDRKHHVRLGDTTVVYWADRCDDVCAEMMCDFLDARPRESSGAQGIGSDPDQLIDDVMTKLACGLPLEGVDLDANFFVLGLAPNAARLSVRFFQRNAFGDVLDNLRRHYDRLDVARAPYEKKYLTPYRLLAETENPNAKQAAATSVLGGALMRSILGDLPYPEALYENTILRVRATQDNDERHTHKVTRGRAAIIKAYLLKNKGRSEEEVTVALNEGRTDAPYVLGRLFSVLEGIQDAASPGVNATIKNKYYDSASATPSVVFPLVVKLSDRHLEKLGHDSKGLAVHYEKMRGELLDKIDAFPKRLTLEEQGDFILGYHHQTQKRYEKKEQDANQDQEA
ncbi:type I-C CRISPR-associated protein Cas8c/Csd1 [Eggerthella sinensis]|uniref:type I-C CRISPR-associated protein Cas8c/Csd1 n=1 Tax=Eggerthella sinensis TaxID=242230 RepID=UPI00266BDB68|nr:type I-C CRISPR-associated protein Cas8c/Csd1 [Eggerthella sinensis]